VGSLAAVLIVSAISPPGLALALLMVLFNVFAVLALIDEVRQP
jgi:hypothetical protein